MGTLSAIFAKDLRRHASDPMAVAIWAAIPLVIGVLLTLATGGSGGASPSATVLVVDEDRSLLSELLVGALERSGGLVEAEDTELGPGLARMEDGGATALLVIPSGFGKALLEERSTELELVTNPGQRILPGILSNGLQILAEGAFYVHRVLGAELREIIAAAQREELAADEDVASMAISMNQAMRRFEDWLFPPRVDLEIRATKAEESTPRSERGFSVLFLPGIVLMALFFTAQGLSEDIWSERELGTLRRFATTPRSLTTFLSGKVSAGMVVVAGTAAVPLLLGTLYHGLPFGRFPLALGWVVVFGASMLATLLLVQLFASSRSGGSVLTNTLVFPLLMIGGSFFPFEVMPEWMGAIGRRTPNGWALEKLKAVLFQGVGASSLIPGAAACVALGAISFFLCTWRLRAFAR